MNLSPVAAVVTLPLLLAIGAGLHLATATAVKAVLRAFEPMAPGELAIAEYERRVLSTAEPGVVPVVAAMVAVGLAAWLAVLTGIGPLWLAVPAALGASVWLDLRAWERVVVSAEHVWYRRGQGQPVQAVPIERIADVGVDTTEVAGFTPRHGRRAEVSRLWLRLTDRTLLVLPATDAGLGEEAVEAVANHVRSRRAHWMAQGALRQAEARGSAAARAAAAAGPSGDAELTLALQRLRQQALAPDDPRPRPPASTPGGTGGRG